MTEATLIITNFPDPKSAEILAQTLVEKRLAACVNIMSPCTSVYRWQDQLETDQETPVFIKTQTKHHQQIKTLINTMHPYELAEVIVVPITDGSSAYLQWIIDETT